MAERGSRSHMQQQESLERQQPFPTPPTKKCLAHPSYVGFEDRLRLWTLRILCNLGVVWSDDFQMKRFINDTRDILPVEEPIEDVSELADHYQVLLGQVDNQSVSVKGLLARNLAKLTDGLNISDVDIDLLALLIFQHSMPWFAHICDTALDGNDVSRASWRIAQIFDVNAEEVERALRPSSGLNATGLVQIDESMGRLGFSLMVDVNRRFIRLLTRVDFNLNQLLEQAARSVKDVRLKLSDYDHMSRERDLLTRYLQGIRDHQVTPATVLLDGPPGVGKSELAKLLAAELGFKCWAVNELDEDGDAASPSKRLSFLRMCQTLLRSGKETLILFDEADGVLSEGHFSEGFSHRTSRAALINYLENLSVPVIWIVNDGEMIHPALLRRMDLHIRFEKLPTKKRAEMLAKALPQSMDSQEPWVRRLSREKSITPARIAQAEKIARLVTDRNSVDQTAVFRQVLEVNLGLDKEAGRSAYMSQMNLPYRLDLINADEDLSGLVSAMKRSPIGRIGLYGPPGTGKTRFVQHMAEECGLDLAEYRASDLMDKWVGSSEQNIRQMFEVCDNPDTLLLLDEADSLIADRSGVRQSWQVSQVNELLKGLESFKGLFVASTNLMDRLDPAVLRRLDYKIHFGWLQPEQSWRLFLDLARHAGLHIRGNLATSLKRRVCKLSYLTPGDFAVLARQLKIRPRDTSGSELIELLEKEMRIKPEIRNSRSIGFTASV